MGRPAMARGSGFRPEENLGGRVTLLLGSIPQRTEGKSATIPVSHVEVTLSLSPGTGEGLLSSWVTE